MTIATPLGVPPPAEMRGGDCRARDLNQGRNVHGPHRFASPAHCRISNGLLRLTVGASGAVPSLTMEARRGRVVVGDVYVDAYVDLYGGSIGTPTWLAMGTVTIDSPNVSALLTAVRLVRISPEAVTIRLVASLMADAFVTLRRGERQVRIQHGSTRAPLVDIARRVRWTDTAAPAGTALLGRVEETTPANDSFRRFVAAIDPVTVDGPAFSLVATSVSTARFGAGIGTYALGDRSVDMHRQLADASRPRLVVA